MLCCIKDRLLLLWLFIGLIRMRRLPQQIKCFSAANFSICLFSSLPFPSFSFNPTSLWRSPYTFFSLFLSNPCVFISLTNNSVYLPTIFFSFKFLRLRSLMDTTKSLEAMIRWLRLSIDGFVFVERTTVCRWRYEFHASTDSNKQQH